MSEKFKILEKLFQQKGVNVNDILKEYQDKSKSIRSPSSKSYENLSRRKRYRSSCRSRENARGRDRSRSRSYRRSRNIKRRDRDNRKRKYRSPCTSNDSSLSNYSYSDNGKVTDYYYQYNKWSRGHLSRSFSICSRGSKCSLFLKEQIDKKATINEKILVI